MPKQVDVIRHVAFEDLGILDDELRLAGYSVQYLEAGQADLSELARRPPADLLVVLGGPISVNDGAMFPFIGDELKLLSRRMTADLPTLGICLGAQLMARALGARVFPGTRLEIGWAPLVLRSAAAEHPIQHLHDTPVLHWHGETFDLPSSARLLASTTVCENQAFAVGRRGLALQFHAEVEAHGLERWYIGHIAELSAAGLSVTELRAQAARHHQALRDRASTFFRQWLSEL